MQQYKGPGNKKFCNIHSRSSLDLVEWAAAFFAVFIFSSTLLNKVVMEVTVPHFLGFNRTRSDRKPNIRK